MLLTLAISILTAVLVALVASLTIRLWEEE